MLDPAELADGGRLHCRASDLRDQSAAPCDRFPDAHRIRLDLETAVCVLTEEIGGVRAGIRHDLVIEVVDADLPDDLFDVPFDREAVAGLYPPSPGQR